MNILALDPHHGGALNAFFGQLSERDLTLIKEDVADPDAVRGWRKLVVELAADQEHALAMFGSLGFTGEALLRDHIRDRDGELHDLVMLAHFVDGAWASMETVGLSDELAYSEELGKEGSPR